MCARRLARSPAVERPSGPVGKTECVLRPFSEGGDLRTVDRHAGAGKGPADTRQHSRPISADYFHHRPPVGGVVLERDPYGNEEALDLPPRQAIGRVHRLVRLLQTACEGPSYLLASAWIFDRLAGRFGYRERIERHARGGGEHAGVDDREPGPFEERRRRREEMILVGHVEEDLGTFAMGPDRHHWRSGGPEDLGRVPGDRFRRGQHEVVGFKCLPEVFEKRR